MRENFNKSYVFSKGNRIALCCIAGFFIVGGIFGIVVPYFDDHIGQFSKKVFCGIFGTAMLLGGFYGLVFLLKFKIEVETDRIFVTGAFGTKEIMLSEIDGYKVNPGSYLYLYSGNKKIITILLGLANQEDLLNRAEQKFINLDKAEDEEELKGILSDENLGSNEAERKGKLKRAKKFGSIMTIAGLALIFWGFLSPRPYELVLWLLILFPPAAIGSMFLFTGLIKINRKDDSNYASVDGAFLMPICILGLRTLLDWNVLEWSSFWTPFAVISLWLFGFVLFASRDYRKSTVFIMILFCAAYGSGVAVTLNGMMDKSQPAYYDSKVTDKRISYGKHRTYYFTLSPWGPLTEHREVNVSTREYADKSIGEPVEVMLRQG